MLRRMELLYSSPNCCTDCWTLATVALVRDICWTGWFACRTIHRRLLRGQGVTRRAGTKWRSRVSARLDDLVGAAPPASRPSGTLAVICCVDFGEDASELRSDLGFCAVSVPHLAVECPRRTVQLPGFGIVGRRSDLPDVRRESAIHVMNAQLASDALLDDFADLRSECHARLN